MSSLPLANWRLKAVENTTNLAEIAPEFDDSGWPAAFGGRRGGGSRGKTNQPAQTTVYRASFELPPNAGGAMFALALRDLGELQSVYLNGQPVAGHVSRENPSPEISLAAEAIRPGKNVIAIVIAPPQTGRGNRGAPGGNQGAPGLLRMTTPPVSWKRSLFNGLAQVIVQSSGQPGEITITAKSPGVADGVLKLQAQPATLRAAVR